MSLVPGFGYLSSCNRECLNCRGIYSHQSFGTWGPSVPVALLIGLLCSYVWVRIRPFFTERPEERQDAILQHLRATKTFLTGLQDLLAELWHSTPVSKTLPSLSSEKISKEREDLLLEKQRLRGAIKVPSSETVLGTVAIGRNVSSEDVAKLKHKLNRLGGRHVHQVVDSSILLQSRLPVTAHLLDGAWELAKQGIELDQRSTLQLGSWGIILHTEGKVQLRKLQDGDVPILVESTREAGQELRVEGLFLEGVQIRAATANRSVSLRSKSFITGGFSHDQGAGYMDVTFVKEPFHLDRGALIYATKIVELGGSAVIVRSSLIPVSSYRRPALNPMSIYLLALVALATVVLPRSFWWPILGGVGEVFFLPVLQLVAVVAGLVLGNFMLLGGSPMKRHQELNEMYNLWGPDDHFQRLISPWDSAVKMEMTDVNRQLVQRLEKQPTTSMLGIHPQQVDYHTEYWRKGLADMNQAIELEPQKNVPFRIRGCIKGLSGDYEGAVGDLDKSLQLRQDDVLALLYRGVFKFLSADCEGSLADLNQAIKHDPAQPVEVIKLRDYVKKVLEERKELVKLRAENAQLNTDLAELRLAKEKLQADLSRAEEALKRMPQNQTLELQYNNVCCEKCISDIKGALYNVPGVESVTVDIYTNRVKVTGYVATSAVLQVTTKTSPSKVITLISATVEPEPKPKPDPKPQPASDPEPVSKPISEPESSPEPKPNSEPAPEPSLKPEAKSEPEQIPEPQTQPQPETEPQPQSKPEPDREPETQSTPKLETKPEPESAETSKAEQPKEAPATGKSGLDARIDAMPIKISSRAAG